MKWIAQFLSMMRCSPASTLFRFSSPSLGSGAFLELVIVPSLEEEEEVFEDGLMRLDTATILSAYASNFHTDLSSYLKPLDPAIVSSPYLQLCELLRSD
jgi:hypothetical protein